MDEKFVVIFYDEDRKTILDKQEVNKGESVRYQGKTPEKAAENGIEYIFVGWETTGNIDMVTENIDIFAKYEATTKNATKEENNILQLSELNAETAKLNDVMQAGQKVNSVEKATRNMTLDEKKDLVNQVKEKGSVDLDNQIETQRD